MKLIRSTLLMAAATLTALTLYFGYAAPSPADLADASATTTTSAGALAPTRTLLQNVTNVISKVVAEKKRIADLGFQKSSAEAGIKPSTAGERHPLDESLYIAPEDRRHIQTARSPSRQGIGSAISTLDVVEG
jgi:hypothetical protein